MSVELDGETGELRAERPIRESGNSLVVSLPPEMLRAAGFEPGETVFVTRGEGGESIRLVQTGANGESND